jgi:hypothetical protein
MGKDKFGLRTMLVATAALGISFAVLGVMITSILSLALLIIALKPFTTRWQTCELAVTIAWLLATVVAFSNVSVSVQTFGFFLVSVFLLCCTWTLREFVRWTNQSPKIVWSSLLALPCSMILAMFLFATDLDLSLRLALSESALIADLRRIDPLHRKQAHRVGLLVVSDVRGDHGGVFMRLDDTFANRCTLAYYPRSCPSPCCLWLETRLWGVVGLRV